MHVSETQPDVADQGGLAAAAGALAGAHAADAGVAEAACRLAANLVEANYELQARLAVTPGALGAVAGVAAGPHAAAAGVLAEACRLVASLTDQDDVRAALKQAPGWDGGLWKAAALKAKADAAVREKLDKYA